MGKNKVMEAKNRKARMYDMERNNYVNNGEVSLEYKYFEVIPYTNGDKVRKDYDSRKFARVHADENRRLRMVAEYISDYSFGSSVNG